MSVHNPWHVNRSSDQIPRSVATIEHETLQTIYRTARFLCEAVRIGNIDADRAWKVFSGLENDMFSDQEITELAAMVDHFERTGRILR